MKQPATPTPLPANMSQDTHITSGELYRAVELIRTDIRDVKTEIGDKPSRREVGYLEKRVEQLENWQSWAMRVGIPGIVTGIAGFVGLILRIVV